MIERPFIHLLMSDVYGVHIMDLKSRYLARGRAIDALDLFLWLHFCYESTATNFRFAAL